MVRLVLLIGILSPGKMWVIEAQAAEEYALKAAYLFNFAKFVEWPEQSFASATSSLQLCVLGRDPFGTHLDAIQGKTAGGRTVTVRYFSDVGVIDECHILFISTSERTRLPLILNDTRHRSMLTVSDIDHFAQTGGMIELVEIGQRIRFTINLDSVSVARLRISSKLLKLATIIEN